MNIPKSFQLILASTAEAEGGAPTLALLRLFEVLNVSHDGSLPGMAEAAAPWRTGQLQYQI
jgi:hypothetical protein